MRFRGADAVLAIVAAMTVATAAPAQTRTGTRIANTARLSLTDGGDAAVVIDSNTVTIAVATLVDVAIAADRPTAPVAAITPQPIAFTLTNPGNASTTYRLDAVADRAGIVVTAIAPDSDGDGRHDPAIDRPSATMTLAPGASARLFVLIDGALAAGAAITATATATADADATLGPSSGRAGATVRLFDDAEPAALLEKAQSVAAPGGGMNAVAGATVTYTLTARFARDCAAVELDDAVPAGTRFVPGSITLDDRPVSDAADDDAARFDGATVRVTLGDMTAGTVRSIRFKAIIL